MEAHVWKLSMKFKTKQGTKYAVYKCTKCNVELEDEADCEGEKK